MGNKEIDIERLIDSAIAKDGATIPLLPSEPDPSLLSQLNMNRVISWEEAPTPTAFKSGLLKMLIGVLTVSMLVIFSYILLSVSKDPTPMRQSGTTLLPIDSAKEKQNDAIQSKTNKQKQLVKDVDSNAALDNKATNLYRRNKDTVGIRFYNSEDLMIPSSSKIINKDSVKIPIKRDN